MSCAPNVLIPSANGYLLCNDLITGGDCAYPRKLSWEKAQTPDILRTQVHLLYIHIFSHDPDQGSLTIAIPRMKDCIIPGWMKRNGPGSESRLPRATHTKYPVALSIRA